LLGHVSLRTLLHTRLGGLGSSLSQPRSHLGVLRGTIFGSFWMLTLGLLSQTPRFPLPGNDNSIMSERLAVPLQLRLFFHFRLYHLPSLKPPFSKITLHSRTEVQLSRLRLPHCFSPLITSCCCPCQSHLIPGKHIPLPSASSWQLYHALQVNITQRLSRPACPGT
jgi:hypothetical protein